MEAELNKNLQTFISLPKIELHAHLNGSISQSTLNKLMSLKKTEFESSSVLELQSNDLSGCFKLFSIIHSLTDSLEAVYLATSEVIKDFCNDGVCYLELRTTPKVVENVISQSNYIETVLKAINDTCAFLNEKVSVKLLLSVDRKRTFNFAEETVKLANKYFTSSTSVVGVDFSGDPTIGNVHNFIPLLEYAKKSGLKLSIHIAEVPNANEEIKELLKLYPDRLGHGTFLHPSKGGSIENFRTLTQLNIPLEICLSSNVISKTVPSFEDHHFPLFRKMDYPCLLCTDDKGIFNTTLSNEYFLASKYYSMSESDLLKLSYNSIDYIFSPTSTKERLRKLWKPKTDQFFK